MGYADRVRAGVALLDNKRPGWHRKIDLAVLDIRSCQLCVLGQLFDGVPLLDDPIQVEGLGFDATMADYHSDRDDLSYKILNRLWTYVIRQRHLADMATYCPLCQAGVPHECQLVTRPIKVGA